jgi:hypothetical protein
MLSKKCTKCFIEKPLEEFCHNSKGLYKKAQRCKKCSAKITADFREVNHNKYYAAKFKTTEEIIEKVLSKDVCDICGKQASKLRRHAIDHCHKTGKIRGLLCDTCNKGLGLFYDNIDLMQKAIDYLRSKHGT